MSATRQELLRLRRRLERVDHGVALLRRKREALVAELFRAARPAVDARRRIAAVAAEAHRALLDALAIHGADGLRALGWPARELEVDVELGQVWGVPVPRVGPPPPLVRTLEKRGLVAESAGPEALDAAARHERLVELLLEAAPRELLLRALGEALARTSRQLGTLERIVAPELRARIHAIAGTLDEREREDQVRARHRAARPLLRQGA